MVNIIFSYGIIISILISFVDGKYISNEIVSKSDCLTDFKDDYVDFACKLFYFYLKINFNKTIHTLLKEDINVASNNTVYITSISSNSNRLMKITFNSPEHNDEYIIINVPERIFIQQNLTNNQRYLSLDITNSTNDNTENVTLLINLTAFRENSLVRYNSSCFILNIKNNDYFYIRKFSFRYTFSSKSSLFGNLFILIGCFIAFRGYSRLNVCLTLMTICCFQIMIEKFIEIFKNSVSFDEVYVTFAIISSIIFGLFAGLFMAYKNYFMFAYYTCLFGMVYKTVSFFCMNLLNTFPKRMEYINIIVMSIGSIVFGYVISLTKAGNDKYKKFVGVLTTSLFGVNLIITGMSFMVKYFDYDRYYYEKNVKDGIVDKMCLIGFIIPLGLQYVGIYLSESAEVSTQEKSCRASQSIRNVIDNLEESKLFPGRDTEERLGNDVESEHDRHSARITQMPSRDSEYEKNETYGVDNNYIIENEPSFDRNDE